VIVLTEKLPEFTTVSIPRGISPKSGNSRYKSLHNLLKNDSAKGPLIGAMCSVLSLISDKEFIEDKVEGSKFTFGDRGWSNLSHSILYTVLSLQHNNFTDNESLKKLIDHKLIPTGYQLITESTYSDLCDIMLSVLDK